MSKESYSIESIGNGGRGERESNFEAPIVDIVRHGLTDYKELKDPAFVFDPQSEGFKLDAEHLDLTEEGIEDIRETAMQLEGIIDKENEIILIVSSPNFRAHSTALVLEDYLRSHGVTMLLDNAENPSSTNDEILGPTRTKIPTTDSLRQITFRNLNDRGVWIAKDEALRAENKTNKAIPPEQAHGIIAARLGKTISDFFTEDYRQIGQRFNRFLRHAGNIYDYLSNDTKERLRGKKLRIIAVTHEEVLSGFAKQALETEGNIKRGQILEIKPGDKLRKGDKDVTEVILYPKGGQSESGRQTVVRKFSNQA